MIFEGDTLKIWGLERKIPKFKYDNLKFQFPTR